MPEDPQAPAAQAGTSPEQSAAAGSADPLLAALAAENEQLRERNSALTGEVATMRQAQAALARHLRVTAPLRVLQQRLRLARSTRRRTRLAGSAEATALAQAPATLGPVTAQQRASHPLLRRTADLVAGIPLPGPPAQPREPVRGRSGRVAVVVHAYYPQLWDELAERIERIPAPVDLVVTLTEGRSEVLGDRIVARFPDAQLVVTANRGRDMWPFARVLELGLIGDHDAVLKLHTKASVHRVDGAAWRAGLLDALCPEPDRMALVLELLRSDPRVGMVAPAGAVLGAEFWGANGPLVDALAVRTGIGAVDPLGTWFAGGSMFWARPEPMLRLRDAALTVDDFEYEAVAIDGTTAHALERFVGALVGAAGQLVIGSDEVAGRLAQARLRTSGVDRPLA